MNTAAIANPVIYGWAGYEMRLSEADRRSPIGRLQLDAANMANIEFCNGTILTDEYLCSWQIVIVFEHPLDSATDSYRMVRRCFDETRIESQEIEPLMDLHTSLDCVRKLLRISLVKYGKGLATEPLLIHKIDLNHGEHGVIGKLCEKLHLQKPPVPAQELQGRRRRSVEAAAVELFRKIGEENAECYINGTMSEWEARLDMKMLKWVDEFGSKDAKLIREQARSAMPSCYAFAGFCLSVWLFFGSIAGPEMHALHVY